MQIRYISMCSIPDDILLDNGIDLNDKDAIQDFFWEMGGFEEFEDYGVGFEVLACE